MFFVGMMSIQKLKLELYSFSGKLDKNSLEWYVTDIRASYISEVLLIVYVIASHCMINLLY